MGCVCVWGGYLFAFLCQLPPCFFWVEIAPLASAAPLDNVGLIPFVIFRQPLSASELRLLKSCDVPGSLRGNGSPWELKARICTLSQHKTSWQKALKAEKNNCEGWELPRLYARTDQGNYSTFPYTSWPSILSSSPPSFHRSICVSDIYY